MGTADYIILIAVAIGLFSAVFFSIRHRRRGRAAAAGAAAIASIATADVITQKTKNKHSSRARIMIPGAVNYIIQHFIHSCKSCCDRLSAYGTL